MADGLSKWTGKAVRYIIPLCRVGGAGGMALS